MAIHIGRLNGGDITVGTSGSVLDATKTRFTLEGGTVETHNITGTLDQQWMIDNGYWVPWDDDTEDGDYWAKTITQVDIGNTVTSIGNYAFSICEVLTNVTIPNSVTSIGAQAFYECSSLTSITIPDSVTSIGDDSFSNCEGLTDVTIPNSVTNIGGYAFQNCTNLTSVTIPDSVTNIEEGAFWDCVSLTSVTIVATGKPSASAANVKQAMIDAGVDENITWNMPS